MPESHSYSPQYLDQLQDLLDQGKVTEYWSSLAENGDTYADDAAIVTGSEPETVFDEVIQGLVKQHWDNTAGEGMYGLYFDEYALKHAQNYMDTLREGHFPSTDEIIDSYHAARTQVNAEHSINLPATTVFDTVWNSAQEFLHFSGLNFLDWDNLLGMSAARDTGTPDYGVSGTEALTKLAQDFSEVAASSISGAAKTFARNAAELINNYQWALENPGWIVYQALPPWAQDAIDRWRVPGHATSPLILDLDGDGIEISSLTNSQTRFDLNINGFAEHTAWTTGDDGFLAIDLNENGNIDNNSELFGTDTVDGFTVLTSYDSNSDGVIDASDEDWSLLRIWQDINSDGVVDEAELLSLDDWNIISIALSGVTEVTDTLEGNDITHISTYSYDTGSGTATRDIKDIWFQNDQTNTVYLEDFTLNSEAIFLPVLRGFGKLPSLHISASIDSEGAGNLLDLLKTFTLTDVQGLFSPDTDSLITDILYRWAGVDGVDPGSRGEHTDAQKLEFFEAFFGEAFIQGGHWSDPTGLNAGSLLNELWDFLFGTLRSHLIGQTTAVQIFADGAISYNPFTGEFEGTLAMDESFITTTLSDAAGNALDGAEFWQKVAEFLQFVKDPTVTELGWLDQAVSNSGVSGLSDWNDVLALFNPVYGEDWTGTSGADTHSGTNLADLQFGDSGDDTLSGLAGNDEIDGYSGNDTIDGGSGNDKLIGGSGNDTLTGGDGNDTLYAGNVAQTTSGTDTLDGGAGHDLLYGDNGAQTYLYNAGDDGIFDEGGTDTIVITDNTIGAADLTFVRTSDDSLTIVVGGLGSIFIDRQFYLPQYSEYAVETLQFTKSGESSINLLNLATITSYGTEEADIITANASTNDLMFGYGGRDTIHGGAGNDTIYGGADSDIIDGGSGNDVLYGEDGNDTITGGTGNDTIYGGAGNDAIDPGTGDDIVYGGAGNDTITAVYDPNNSFDDLKYIYGDAGNDTITMADANDHVSGGDGNDTIYGGDGNDTLDGDAGNDIIDGGKDNDTIHGGDGNDSIHGGYGVDSLYGDDGDDTLSGDNGNDSLYGGDGNDTYQYGSGDDGDTIVDDGGSSDAVQLTGAWLPENISFSIVNTDDLKISISGLSTQWVLITDHFNTSVSAQVEKLVFTDGYWLDLSSYSSWTIGTVSSQTLNGTSANDTILGRGGADILNGSDGSDHLSGDGGNDTLNGGVGDDWLHGGSGDDVLNGGTGDDYLHGSTGTDTATYVSATGSVTIDLQSGTASGADGNDILISIENATGSSYDDLIYSSSLSNVINGGSGIDTVSFVFATGAVTANISTGLATGQGTDTLISIENIDGSSYNDTITGNASANIIDGGAGNDTINADAGNDTLIGGTGDDTLNGEAGTDTVSYATSASAITANLATGSATGEGTDILLNIENLTGSDYADTLTGDAQANVLSGGAGNDTISGGAGNDTIDGGSGTDTIDYSAAASGVTVNLAAGTANNDGDGGSDTLSSIESVTGSAYADTITGDSGTNVLSGGAGADTLDGGNGSDILNGGNDNDTLKGGAGNDVIDGGSGTDTLDYSAAASGVTVNLATGTASKDGDGGSDTISNVENVSGSASADTITGDSGANNISGGSGDDVIEGGSGDDILDGGSGTDTASYAGATAAVTVTLATSSAQNTVGAGTDTLSNFENLTGSAYNDNLTGNSSTNTLTGGAGNDTLKGGAGNDMLDGGSGTDTVDYSAVASGVTVNLATGMASNDGDGASDTLTAIENVTGSAYADTITGSSDNNIINGRAGNDTMDGGAGTDTVDYSTASSAVTVNITTGTATGDGTDTLSNFENIIGSAYSDTLTGNSGVNVLYGGSGNDTLKGLNGDDILYGDDGADFILGGNDNDILYGGNGNDEIWGENGDDTIYGGDGNDYFRGYAGNDYMDGGAGIDEAYFQTAVVINLTTGTATGEGTDVLVDIENITSVNSANTTVTGNNSANVISTYSGNDIIYGEGGDDTLYGGNGNDILYGGDGDDTLQGYSGNTAGNDTLYGNDGNDVFLVNAGSDYIDGGAGTDTVSYANANVSVVVDLAAGTVTKSSGFDTLISIERSIGSVYDDTLIGDSSANNLYGMNGNDLLIGGGGDDYLNGSVGTDTLIGGTGDDVIDGGTGSDTVSYTSALSAVTVNLATGTATGGDGNDTIINVENIIGSSFNDTLTGDGNANLIEGGGGNDAMNGGAGTDTLTYANAAAAVTVNLSTTTAQNTGGAGTDTVSNFENLTGSAFNDNLFGNTAANVIDGGAGNDIIDGGAGNDTLIGGVGTDTVSYASTTAAVTVSLATAVAQNTLGAGTDTISGFENLTGSAFNDTLTGDGGVNTIDGDAGNDTIRGGGGNDVIKGGAGADTLYGESGADTFSFQSATAFTGQDTVSDFSTAQGDKLDIADILSGYYTYGVDDITQFVQITDNGTDSTLKIDQNGGGDNFVAVAAILGVTGLTNEAALETSGALITH